MASLIPKFVKKEITDAWVAETWKLMLLSDVHVPDAANQQYVADVVANEIGDIGGKYTTGGIAVAGKVSLENGNNYALDATDIVIGTGANLNYRYGILFVSTGNQATEKIRAQIDFLANQIVVNGTSTITWNALGIIYVS
jgi:hypothetical protein